MLRRPERDAAHTADALYAILAELQPVEGSKHRGVSAELLERMRALGYVEP